MQETKYNDVFALGKPWQVELRTLGSNLLKTDYIYFGWGEANGQGRLMRILSGTTANSSTGALIGELRYKAWGEQRYSSGTTYTNRRYTGQLRESSLGGVEGLYFFNARWVDVYGNHNKLGRLADS